MTSSARRRTPQFATVAWLALATFLLIVAFLALQMRAGDDPALKAFAAQPVKHKRRVLVRRVVKRKVIVHLVPAQTDRGPSLASGGGGGGYSGGDSTDPASASSAGSSSSSASAPAAPSAPPPVAAAPAPAPPPAPVTRSS
jgi:uncharacterized membrane protein YgcG